MKNSSLIVDADGNVYQSVIIGTQEWLTTDLRTTKCNDGTPIPLVEDRTAWGALTTPGYSWYDNDKAGQTAKGYAPLYNWATVNQCDICPSGWRIPTDEELKTLINYLGGKQLAGGSIKEAGTTHWASPNTGANNKSGYTALSGGSRGSFGTFSGLSNSGLWWSSTEVATNPNFPQRTAKAWSLTLSNQSSGSGVVPNNRKSGFSIRCIKNT